MTEERAEAAGPLDAFRQFFALRRDVLVLSVAMFAFSLGFQMTNRFLPEYLRVLGASGFVAGLYGTLGNVIGAVYPYPGGAISDRLGSRYALTLFGALSTLGFLVWLVAPTLGAFVVAGVTIQPWLWVFVGLLLAQAWKSLGLGATFAVVKQATDPARLAAGFASTETFRRTAFFAGPALATVLIGLHPEFVVSFQYVLAAAVGFGALGTLAQHWLYDAGADTVGDTFAGIEQVRQDIREMPDTLRPLLVADTLVRFANGIVYVFVIYVITDPALSPVGLETTLSLGGFSYALDLTPAAFFGVLISLEMVVALLTMAPAAKVAERVGLKPVVGLGFLVYAVFPALLITAPATPVAMLAVFAFSGLRFAGLPSHKALIVGPAEADAGGRVTGTYYLLRNTAVIPSAALGGYLYDSVDPAVAFWLASAIGLVGVASFALFGEEFEAYR